MAWQGAGPPSNTGEHCPHLTPELTTPGRDGCVQVWDPCALCWKEGGEGGGGAAVMLGAARLHQLHQDAGGCPTSCMWGIGWEAFESRD